MMLRSSSTPILGSLLSSYSESPNHNHSHNHLSEFNSPKHLPTKFLGHLHLITPSSHSFNSSPSVNAEPLPSVDWNSSPNHGFRRAQSDGNLQGLLTRSCGTFDEFNHSFSTNKFPRRPGCAVLQTIPSFSVYNPDRKEGEQDEEHEEESGEEYEDEVVSVQSAMRHQIRVDSDGSGMAFLNSMGIKDRNVPVDDESNGLPSKMHLAKGLGALAGGYNGGDGSGGRKEYKTRDFGGENSDGSMDEYYKKMVEENPGDPLFLRNYAQFLHQSEDLKGAEEYYSRAILMDPRDGEVLSQYAKVTWELHGDEERASGYFERAVQASPEDSHVLAAYAGFLWETEEAEDDLCTIHPLLHENALAAAAT